MIEVLALEVLADPFADLGRRQLSSRLQDRPLAVHPARLDRGEPRALDRRVTGNYPRPAVLLDPPVVRLDPGPYPLADVPTGIVPDQKQRLLPLRRQPRADPLQEVLGHLTDRAAVDEPHQHAAGVGPQQSVAAQRL